ncbi:MAG: hypothetical protein E6G36_09260 [Actinobacteria bacterium]|nr:MAG: hypothetical protein E6G36_09260 [Actinomycetota bacterium]
MRRLLVIGLAAAATPSPAVPLRAQQAIRLRVEPLLAYVPSSLPAGYHYARWMEAHSRPRGLTIWFRWRRLRDPGLGFNVAEGCPEFGEPMKTYRFGRVSVRWSTTYTDAQAWRCLTRGNRRFYVYVTAPGYGLGAAPPGRSLARVVASARPLR